MKRWRDAGDSDDAVRLFHPEDATCGIVVDFMQQHTVIDSVLLTLAAPLAMDSFTVVERLD